MVVKFVSHEGVEFKQRDFWHAIRETWKGAWTKEAVKKQKGLKMQGLVPFNRAPLWKHFPNSMRAQPEHECTEIMDEESRAEQAAERISIPGAPGLQVIARVEGTALDMTFDGSPESYVRAPLNIDKLNNVLKNVDDTNSCARTTFGS